MKKSNLDWLQALRGVAALLVVISHARIVLRGTPYEAFAERELSAGAMGVDLFFMISGFVMAYTTTDSDASLKYSAHFWIKRFARVWPVYVVAILVEVALLPERVELLGSHTYLLSMLKSAFFLPIDATTPPFFGLPYGIGWTLNFEIYFYIVFGISMLWGRYRWVGLVCWFVITLIGLPLLKSGHAGLDIRQTYGFTTAYVVEMVNPIVWEFLIGVAIAQIYMKAIKLPKGWITYALVLLTTTFAFWHAFSGQGNFNGLDQWGWPLAIMLLVFALASKSVALPIPTWIIWLGGISYSLYLFHPLAIGLTRTAAIYIGPARAVQTWPFFGLVTGTAILTGALANAVLEKHLSVRLRNRMLGAITTRAEVKA